MPPPATLANMQNNPTLRTDFTVEHELTRVFTGGRPSFSKEHIYLPCGEEVKRLKLDPKDPAVETIRVDEQKVNCTALSNGILVAGTRGKSLTFMQGNGHTIEHRPAGDNPVMTEFSPSGEWLAAACGNGLIQIYTSSTRKLSRTCKVAVSPSALAFHPLSTYLAVSNVEGKVCLFDVSRKSKEALATLEQHTSRCSGLCWTEEGDTLVSVGRDMAVVIHSCLRTGGEEPEAKRQNNPVGGDGGIIVKSSRVWTCSEELLDVCALWGKYVAIIGLRGVVQVLDVGRPNGEMVVSRMDSPYTSGQMTSIHYLSSLRQIAVANDDDCLLFYSLESAAGSNSGAQDAPKSEAKHKKKKRKREAVETEIEGPLVIRMLRTLAGNLDVVGSLQWMDGNRFVVSSNCPNVRIFDRNSLWCQELLGHGNTVMSMGGVRDGSWICSGDRDGLVRVWRRNDGGSYSTAAILNQGGQVSCLCCTQFTQFADPEEGEDGVKSRGRPIGPLVVLVGSPDGMLKLWDLSYLMKQAEGGEAEELKTPTLGMKVHEQSVTALDISPKNQFAATTGKNKEKVITIWEMGQNNLTKKRNLRGHRKVVNSLAFSLHDRLLVSGSSDKNVRVWSVTDGSCLKTFQGHTGPVLAVSFFNHGLQLVSTDHLGMMKVWIAKTGECVGTMPLTQNANALQDDSEEPTGVWALKVSNDDQFILAGTETGGVKMLKDQTKEKEESKMKLRQRDVVEKQKLSNMVRDGEFEGALKLAFQLRMPIELRNVVSSLVHNRTKAGEDPLQALGAFTTFVGEMESGAEGVPEKGGKGRDAHLPPLARLLSYCRQWNTTAGNSEPAQWLLQAILKNHSIETLSRVRGIEDLIAPLIAYSLRHQVRLGEMWQDSFLVEDLTMSGRPISKGTRPQAGHTPGLKGAPPSEDVGSEGAMEAERGGDAPAEEKEEGQEGARSIPPPPAQPRGEGGKKGKKKKKAKQQQQQPLEKEEAKPVPKAAKGVLSGKLKALSGKAKKNKK